MAEYFPHWSDESKDDDRERSESERDAERPPKRTEFSYEALEHQQQVALEAARRAAKEAAGFKERIEPATEDAEKAEYAKPSQSEAIELHEETGADIVDSSGEITAEPAESDTWPQTAEIPPPQAEEIGPTPESAAEPIAELRAIAHEARERLTEPDPAVEMYLAEIEQADNPDPEIAEEHAKERFDLKPVEAQADHYLLDPEVQRIIENIDERLETEGGEMPKTVDDFGELTETELNELERALELELPEIEGVEALESESLPDAEERTAESLSSHVAPTRVPTQHTAPAPPIGPPNWYSGGGGNSGGSQVVGAPMPASPNVLPGVDTRVEHRQSRRWVLVVGAYLVGRHRGRKAGERKQMAKMRPQLEKLSKTNKDLQFQVNEGQRRIRSLRRIQAEQAALIAEQANRESGEPSPAPAETPPTLAADTPEFISPSPMATPEITAEPALQPETTNSSEQFAPPSTSFEVEAAPEAPVEQRSQPEPDRAGAPEMPRSFSEAETVAPVEETREKMRPVEAPTERISVGTMTAPELMQIAQNVRLEGINAAQMYQEGRLDDQALRRVVAEYARGGTPEETLVHELGVVELRRAQSPEFLHENREKVSLGAGPSEIANAETGGLATISAAATDTSSSSLEQFLPAYDDQDYPSDTPEPLLPAVALPDHHTDQTQVIIFAAGLGLVIAVALAFLFL